MFYQCMEGLQLTANTRNASEKVMMVSVVRITIVSIFEAIIVKNYHHERRQEGTLEGLLNPSITKQWSSCRKNLHTIVMLHQSERWFSSFMFDKYRWTFVSGQL